MQNSKYVLFFLFFISVSGCTPSSQLGSDSQTIDPRDYPREEHNGLLRGDFAPDFRAVDIDGQEHSLSEFAGKPLLLVFIATWCPYCDKDFKVLGNIYPEYPDINIIAVDLDLKENSETLRSYKQKYSGIENVIFAPGNEEILRTYSIRLTTTKYAIGRDGKILYAGSGAFKTEQWKVLLDALKNS